jgi:hypothetical protein
MTCTPEICDCPSLVVDIVVDNPSTIRREIDTTEDSWVASDSRVRSSPYWWALSLMRVQLCPPSTETIDATDTVDLR